MFVVKQHTAMHTERMWCLLAPNKVLHHDTQVEARGALARPHASKTMPRKSRQTRRHLANLLARTHLGCFDAHPHLMHVEEARKREREVRVLGTLSTSSMDPPTVIVKAAVLRSWRRAGAPLMLTLQTSHELEVRATNFETCVGCI